MLRQRVYGLALGYEDLNDQNLLRHDPALHSVKGTQAIGQQLNNVLVLPIKKNPQSVATEEGFKKGDSPGDSSLSNNQK